MIQIKAGGGVICHETDDRLQVLLIFRNGVWDLPKGKQEEGETIEMCARREVAEEVGIPLPVIEHFLCKTYHQYERNGLLYHKETHWFKMKTKAVEFTPQLEEDITKIKWFSITKAKEVIGYPTLIEVLDKLQHSGHCS